MSDLISREQAIAKIEDLNTISFYELNEHSKEAYSEIMAAIKNLPSAEAEMPDKWLFINEKNEPKFWQYNIRNGQISPITDLEDTSITWSVGMPFEEIKGKWKNIDIIHDRADAKITDWQQAQCSVCGKWHTTPYLYCINLDPYCPSCGARMVNK